METRRENIELQTNNPNYGKVIKTDDGRIVCHICGKPFRKLCGHVVQKHGIAAWEYKVMFGLDTIRGLISDEYRQRLSDYAIRNYDVVVKQNLIEGGAATRFVKHSKGRVKAVMSEQTRLRIIEQGKRTQKKDYGLSKRLCLDRHTN